MIKEMRVQAEGGFTLVELLIVIAIIAILAAIAIPQFAQYQERAIRAGMISDAKNVATMEEANFGDNQNYTQPATNPVPLSTSGTAFSLGSQAGRLSKSNSMSIAVNGSTYTIYMNNPNAGVGSTNYSMDNGGNIGWYAP